MINKDTAAHELRNLASKFDRDAFYLTGADASSISRHLSAIANVLDHPSPPPCKHDKLSVTRDGNRVILKCDGCKESFHGIIEVKCKDGYRFAYANYSGIKHWLARMSGG